MGAVIPKKKNHKRGSRGKRSKRESRTDTCDSSSETASFSSSTGVSDSLMGWRRNKKKEGVNNKVHSQSSMVRPVTLRVWARPFVDGLEASPIIGIIMRMCTSWPRS